MGEDLKVLKNCWLMTTNHTLDEENIKLKQAIENLIKEYKDLVEKDKQHKKRITYLQNKITNQKEVLRNGVNVVNLNANRMCEVFELIPKSKVREVLDTKYIAMFEGDTEFPDDATIMKTVKYVKVSDIEELLQEGDDK